MENVANEVGIIGQMYQNRRTKKIGILESRNEKYKTLMMRDTEGGSFSIVYSTFKSDWRKVKDEDAVKPVTEKPAEKKPAKEKKSVEKNEAKPTRRVATMKERVEASNNLKETIQKVADEFDDRFRVKTNSRGATVVMDGHRVIIEAWAKPNKDECVIYTVADVKLSKGAEVSESVHDDKWRLKFRYKVNKPATAVHELLKSISKKEEK